MLQGSTNDQQLRVVNTNTGSRAYGIGIHTDPSRPPLAVNSRTKVASLNSDLLDGLDSTALQKRVTGSCGDGSAIAGVNSTGSVSCTKTTQFPIHAVLANGNFLDQFLESSMSLQLQCRILPNGFVGPIFISHVDSDATLNWMFSEGGTTSTVNANGTTVPARQHTGFSLPGTRLEGQFIWSDANSVVTVRLNVVDNPETCQFTGTALIAATS